MKFYIVVEGEQTERILYQSWLSDVFGGIERVYDFSEVSEDCYYLILGNGYPNYLNRVRSAVEDINDDGSFDALFVCVDSEGDGVAAKRMEVLGAVGSGCPCPVHVFVQNICIETWLLGNRKFVRRAPSSPKLHKYINQYDVTVLCPEMMPTSDAIGTEAGFHYDYFRAAAQERNASYSKRRPGVAAERGFFRQLVKRADDTQDIPSFRHMVGVFRGLGGNL